MKKLIITVLYAVAAILSISCDKALNPLDNGYYTDENMKEYPSLVKGFVDEAYALATVTTYLHEEYLYLDCATDNAVATNSTNLLRKMAEGSLTQSADPFADYWARDFNGIRYVNKFLKDRKGINTTYIRDIQQDSLLRYNYQGDAFALRAWFQYDLLSKFAGRGMDGKLYGYPVIDENFDQTTADAASFKRASVDECVAKIIADCDSALVYLPLANRDWLAENTSVQGACRWARFDGMSVTALKALTYLLWASDTFNPEGNVERWKLAATFAANAMQMKLDQDGKHGFKPLDSFSWTDPNSPEIYWCSRNSGNTSTMEKSQYPAGFNGSCLYSPTQELVDAFPAANGYPISDERSEYDPKNPYANRDPRLYATVFFNGANVVRAGSDEVMYTFETYEGGKDMHELTNNGLTGYYLKKFVYLGWNAKDKAAQTMPRAVFYISWRDMCLALAEAANRYEGPQGSEFGISAKEALSYIRSRSTADGAKGIGASSDPYLDECAADPVKFEELVRNERRIEFCFEGKRFFDLMRWNVPVAQRNVPVHRIDIVKDGETMEYSTVEVATRNLKSQFLPVPFDDIVKAPGLVQNEGWDSWSK